MIVRRIVIMVIAVPLMALALYLCAAIVLGLVPLNSAYRPAPGGIDVYLRTNGVHADLIVPIRTRDVDWAARLPLQVLHPIEGVTDDLSIGWGDRGLYIGTPTWGDLRAGTAVRALTGLDPTILHVEAVPIPVSGRETRRMRLSGAQYARLAAFIERGFHRDGAGAVIVVPDAHYGGHDAFFEAEGRYSALMTCNEWARRALSVAGVRVPVWSPFDKALLYQVPPDEEP